MAQNVVINGVTYSNVPEIQIPKSTSGTASFFDISDTTMGAAQGLAGYYFHTADGTKTQGNISTKTSSDLTANTLTVTAPAGYYASAASKTLSDQYLVSGNIKNGVTIFGVSGATNVVDTTISSGAAAASNILSGYSAFAKGSLVEGSATVPTVSQDSSTKVLSIA